MAVPSRDGGVNGSPADGGAGQARESVTLCAEVDKGFDESVVEDPRADTKVLFAMMANDRVSMQQSEARRDRSIGKLRKSIEQRS